MDRLVLHASKHISHVNVYGRYEVTILDAFMAPNRSTVTVTVKTSLFSFNLLHSGKSEICLRAIKKYFLSSFLPQSITREMSVSVIHLES